MHLGSPLVANSQPAVADEPGERALDHPPVPPQQLARLFAPPSDAALDATSAQRLAAVAEVVTLVGVQLLGSLAGPSTGATG